MGSYAEEQFPQSRLFSLPDDTDVVARSMVKGITAECLMRLTYEVGPQTKVLIHAAAGATGAVCSVGQASGRRSVWHGRLR